MVLVVVEVEVEVEVVRLGGNYSHRMTAVVPVDQGPGAPGLGNLIIHMKVTSMPNAGGARYLGEVCCGGDAARR